MEMTTLWQELDLRFKKRVGMFSATVFDTRRNSKNEKVYELLLGSTTNWMKLEGEFLIDILYLQHVGFFQKWGEKRIGIK